MLQAMLMAMRLAPLVVCVKAGSVSVYAALALVGSVTEKVTTGSWPGAVFATLTTLNLYLPMRAFWNARRPLWGGGIAAERRARGCPLELRPSPRHGRARIEHRPRAGRRSGA